MCLLALARATDGSEDYIARHWQIQDGLPQNSVTSILQTPDGYLWFATFNGLARFDGVQFTVFDAGNTAELRSSRLTRLDVDWEGRLWIIAEDGELARFDGVKFRSYGTREGVPAAGVSAVVRGPDRSLLLLDREGGVLRFDGSRWAPDGPWPFLQGSRSSMFTDPEGRVWVWSRKERTFGQVVGHQLVLLQGPGGAGAARVRAFAMSRRKGLWLILESKLWHYAPDRRAWEEGPWTLPPAATGLTCILEDREGNLWVSTYGNGVFRCAPSGACEQYFTGHELLHNAVRALLEDDEGCLWIGSDGGGVTRLKPRLVRVFGPPNGLGAEAVVTGLGVSPLESDLLWVGVNGGGVNQLRHNTMIPFQAPPWLQTNSFVYGVIADRQENLWVGTWDEGLLRYCSGRLTQMGPAAKWSGKPLLCGLEDRAGRVWLGGRFGLSRWENEELTDLNSYLGASNVVVGALAEDRSGHIYVGTYGHALLRESKGQWTSYRRKDRRTLDHISALLVDRDDRLWIGTFNGGLAFLDGEQVHSLDVQDGLPSNTIGAMVESDDGDLWIGSSAGLSRLQKAGLIEQARHRNGRINASTYGISDGLLSLQCGGTAQPAACRTPDGKLWFATVRGLAVIDPAKRPDPGPPPRVTVERIIVDGRDLGRTGSNLGLASSAAARQTELSPTFSIPPAPGRLEFHFTALSFRAPERVQFRYRLLGYDRDWVQIGSHRVAYYTRLPAGKYEFQVTACNDQGIWNETVATRELTVLAPWWDTPLFRWAASTVAAGLGAWLIWLRVKRLKHEHALKTAFAQRLIHSQEQERTRIAAELHDGIGQDVLVIKTRADLALRAVNGIPASEKPLREISELASETLEHVREISRDLRPHQIDRLGLTKALKGMITGVSNASGLRCAAELDDIDGLLPSGSDVHVYRIVQELLNNAVKHSSASEIGIRVFRKHSMLLLEFDDDGRGFDPDEYFNRPAGEHGLGLTDIAERVRIVGGKLQCRSVPREGAHWTVEIPLGDTPLAGRERR